MMSAPRQRHELQRGPSNLDHLQNLHPKRILNLFVPGQVTLGPSLPKDETLGTYQFVGAAIAPCFRAMTR